MTVSVQLASAYATCFWKLRRERHLIHVVFDQPARLAARERGKLVQADRLDSASLAGLYLCISHWEIKRRGDYEFGQKHQLAAVLEKGSLQVLFASQDRRCRSSLWGLSQKGLRCRSSC